MWCGTYTRLFGALRLSWDELILIQTTCSMRRGPGTLATRSIDSLDNPGAYVRRAIVNLAAGTRRRRARYQRALIRLGPPEDAVPSYPSDVEELLLLAPRDRAVLYLRDIEGLAYEEVAEIVGRPASTCRVIASRARKRLAAILDEEVAR